MRRIFRFILLCLLKLISYAFYSTTIKWVSKPQDLDKVDLILVMNHTSLFEFIYIGILPWKYLWRLSKSLIFPVAIETYQKFGIGTVLKALGPKVISVTRKRDDTWGAFLEQIETGDILIFFPEGRMKRPNGLDKNNQPMNVRGGVVDVLWKYTNTSVLFVYSAGLHHVCPPGSGFPKLFCRLAVALEAMKVSEYFHEIFPDKNLERIWLETPQEVKRHVAKNLEIKRDLHCSSLEI